MNRQIKTTSRISYSFYKKFEKKFQSKRLLILEGNPLICYKNKKTKHQSLNVSLRHTYILEDFLRETRI